MCSTLVRNLKYYSLPTTLRTKELVTALEIHEDVLIKSGCLATGALKAGP